MVFCGGCGGSNQDGAVFCTTCGKPFAVASGSTSVQAIPVGQQNIAEAPVSNVAGQYGVGQQYGVGPGQQYGGGGPAQYGQQMGGVGNAQNGMTVNPFGAQGGH